MKELNLTAPICNTGYGIASLNIFLELSKNLEVTLWPLGAVEAPPETHDKIKEAIERNVKFSNYAPSLRIFHQFDMAHSVGKGKRIGFPIFELNELKDNEKHHLNSLDHIVVCSDWAAEILAENKITPTCSVAPLGVNREYFHENLKRNRTEDDCYILNMGKWEKRKGHDLIPEAFDLAFRKDDKVRLVMHTANPFLTEDQHMEWINQYLTTDMGKAGKISITKGRFALPNDIASLMNDCDIGLFPARAEGWNMELLEMLSLGKHVVATNYSGHTQFINDKNASLIEVTELEPAYDGIWFDGEGEWATVNVKDVADKLRELYDSGKWKELNTEGIKTAKEFSWRQTADRIMEIL